MISGHGRTGARTRRTGLLLLLVLAGCLPTPTGEGPGITGDPPPSRPPGVVAPAIVTSSLPAATVGQPYIATLAASGGAIPYRWTVSSGALPAGLTLDVLTGTIAGTPTATGAFNFDVNLATPLGAVARTLTLVVQ